MELYPIPNSLKKRIYIFLLSSLMIPMSQAGSISPESFNKLWNSGNKFRLMRLQAESLNPYSDMYSSGDIKTSYFETNQSYKLQQDESLERTIGSAHVAVNSDHYFVDLGVMDLRDQVGEREGITNKYSRIFLGARYNDLEYVGFSGGLLVSESPKISDKNAFIEYKNDTNVDPFINISLLDINLMLAEVKQDDLFVETLSYGYSYSDYSAKLYRSKIHGNKHNDSISYQDEYTLKLSHKTRCLDNSKLDMIGDCKINVSRRLTYNDQSQGWSFSVDRPYFIMNINTFDEVTELRQDKWGGSIKVGLNFFDKTTPKHGLKLMLSASYNDGITDIFEVPDSLMFGFNFEILGVLNSLDSIAKKTNKPTVSNQSADDIK